MTNKPTKGWRPTGAGTIGRPCRVSARHDDGAPNGGTTRQLRLAVAVAAVALLLATAPVWAQEAEASDLGETPEVDGGTAETSEGSRSVRVGDGCVRIRDEGGEDLTAGSCDGADDAGGRSGGGNDATSEPRRDGKRIPTHNTTGRTVTEETIVEGAARPGATDLEEPSAPESTAPEEMEPADAGCPTVPEGETIEATVERAVDGDTLELAEPVDGFSQVRLIGVDAPEMEGEGGEPEPYAEEAADFTGSELEGERVTLELDEEASDPYGRLLAYVWREQSSSQDQPSGEDERELFNLTLLEGGYATTMPMEPNTRYAGCFEDAGREARGASSGPLGGGGPDDEQYEGSTGLEGTEGEPPTPEADEPEQTLPEETNAGGPAEEGVTAGSDPLPVTDDRPEQASPGVSEPTQQTISGPSGETAGVPDDQYEGAEATVPGTIPSTSEGGSGTEEEAVTRPAATAPAASVPALPTRQTPQGPVPILPETGGLAFLPLVLGALSLAIGAFPLGLLRREGGCLDARSGER